MNATDQTFKSAWDAWLIAVLSTSSLLSVGVTALAAWLEPELSALGRVLLAASGLLTPAILVWIVTTTDYRISGNQLSIRCGPFKWRVPLDTIERVGPSKGLQSSPAGSLDRLAIHRRGRAKILVSPRDRGGFLDALAVRAPHLKRRGERLTSRA